MKTPEQLDYEYQHQMMDRGFDGPAFFREALREHMTQLMKELQHLRYLQKLYFSTRSKDALISSKVVEKNLDDKIRRFFQPECVVEADPEENDHPKLF